MSNAAAKRWAVVYKPGKRPAVLWALILGAPEDATVERVTEALEAWPRWPRWQAQLGVGGQIVVIHESRWGRTKWAKEAIDGGYVGDPIQWATLAGGEKIINTPVPYELYARVSRASRAQGQTLREFCSVALDNHCALFEGHGAAVGVDITEEV